MKPVEDGAQRPSKRGRSCETQLAQQGKKRRAKSEDGRTRFKGSHKAAVAAAEEADCFVLHSKADFTIADKNAIVREVKKQIVRELPSIVTEILQPFFDKQNEDVESLGKAVSSFTSLIWERIAVMTVEAERTKAMCTAHALQAGQDTQTKDEASADDQKQQVEAKRQEQRAQEDHQSNDKYLVQRLVFTVKEVWEEFFCSGPDHKPPIVDLIDKYGKKNWYLRGSSERQNNREHIWNRRNRPIVASLIHRATTASTNMEMIINVLEKEKIDAGSLTKLAKRLDKEMKADQDKKRSVEEAFALFLAKKPEERKKQFG